ncbi:hypothetical protein Dsin_001175 [Dipteronia sinensis]|uniref:DUF1985 domain-containing protein n=1 Tax=Dipteronia sinensis TaxID=43782 RepID=A0AAE0B535_9ROSI|nr:hypothetical protein Dsin_001175 [Dipteronia sinensis]
MDSTFFDLAVWYPHERIQRDPPGRIYAQIMLSIISLKYSRQSMSILAETNDLTRAGPLISIGAIPDTELYKDVSNGIHHRYFGGRDAVTFAELEARIEHGQWTEQFDAVKLCLIYMLNCVLIGAEEKASVPIWKLLLVDDLEAFNAFQWCMCTNTP